MAGKSQPNDYLISNHRESNIRAGRGSVHEDTHLRYTQVITLAPAKNLLQKSRTHCDPGFLFFSLV